MTHTDPPAPFTRRRFLATGIAVPAALLAASDIAGAARSSSRALGLPAMQDKPPAFKLPPLPYKDDALAPHISANTLGFHYGKHHAKYVENLNKAVEANKKFADMTLEKIIETAAKDPADAGTFNNAAQNWNHTFYWSSMKPGGGGEPTGRLAEKIKSDFGDFATFKKQFSEAAAGQFGSGWAWLVIEDGKLKVQKSSNADTPIAHGGKPLLVIDVWEHAYYLDYQNKRADYVTAFTDKLLNWDFAAKNLGS